MAQAELASEADFDRLLQTSSKYVVIFAYEFEVPSMAREYARMFSDTAIAYMVDISEYQDAKEYFGIVEAPTLVVFKDGKELKRVVGMDQEGLEAVAGMLL